MTENSKPTILLVDDSKIQLMFYKKLLRGYYELIYAQSGEQALELVHKEPDLILLDVMMPGINGFETCRRLKSNIKTSHIPVILLTAKAEEADQIEGLQHGADDYIVKPFNSNILLSRI